ncbi:MAG TPA: energy transducer TonB [Azospira sp.]|nr:energy transducer TonB [Azospira sp.]
MTASASAATAADAANASSAYYAQPESPGGAPWRRSLGALAVVAVHLLALAAIGYAAIRPELPPPVRALAVRLLDAPAPPPPRVEPPKPLPPKAAPRPSVTPPPVLAAAPASTAAPAFVVPPQPEPVAAPLVQAPPVPAPAPVVAARFDADYLQNPRPAYPPMSRRQNEEGKVVLRVRVSAQGLPLAVEVRQSSGFARLDEAARKAVERWRFVPARQGDEAIESSVLVPLNFTLSN